MRHTVEQLERVVMITGKKQLLDGGDYTESEAEAELENFYARSRQYR